MTPTPLIERIIISTPMKNHILIDHEYVNCPLRFDDRIRSANLLPIHMFDFDVILGMDWLASHRATIDCYARTVIFGNVRQPEFVYHGSSPLKHCELKEVKGAVTRMLKKSKKELWATSTDCVEILGQKKLYGEVSRSASSGSAESLSLVILYSSWIIMDIPSKQRLEVELCVCVLDVEDGSTKMYRDLKQYFWWNGMKQDVATFVSKCMTCQQVKIEHQRASGFVYSRWEFHVWKWDEISMDFVTGLPILEKNDAIWGVVDRLTQVCHFLPIRMNYGISKLAEILRRKIVRHAWSRKIIEITNEKLAVAKEKLKEARSRQKSYADKHRRGLEFQVGDRVFLKVSPFRGVKRFGIKGKLSPRFIGPFEILERIGRGFVSSWASSAVIATFTICLSCISFEGITIYHPLIVASYPFDQIST
ncbi:retrotransposon protein, putative, ty3-gypsy subclass [Tanacetum coccineum]|uniref:Retrotransposon protein, putative, ty3-gypsy subclass n=1 Tax=Tanacetum coccineum TaxID=301880 RepID=A0ABQ5CVQ6_9ASTR